MDRRTFLGVAAGSLVAPSLAPRRRLRAAVLEFEDRWTNRATGAARLLRDAGFEVVDLPADVPADRLDVDLLLFGSFVNNGDPYRQWIAAHGASLARFAAAGGVVVQMTQSDQYEDRVPWLPEGIEIVRGNRDLSDLVPVRPTHPLLEGWATADVLRYQTQGDEPRSWEVIESWKGVAVLMASELPIRYPALVEAAHGRGRFVISTLWLDKVWLPDRSQAAPQSALLAARGFFTALERYAGLVRAGRAPDVVPTPMAGEAPVGPMVGHVDDTTAFVWYRPDHDGDLQLAMWPAVASGGEPIVRRGRAEEVHDRCLSWRVDGLVPDTEYRYAIRNADGSPLVDTAACRFRTAAPSEQPARVALAFGSCAHTEPNAIWTRMRDEGCEGVVLLGDTPYIDSTDLAKQRLEHRRFLQIPELAALVSGTPVWATWDDHDFGQNDSDGRLPGKEGSRQAFVEYRALPSFGEDGQGIYTSFRRGPLEVFLLDARWFARTGPSPVATDLPTLLGPRQWDWIRRGLQQSTATFKVLATGMIWDDKQNSESDDWQTYAHERDALFDFVAAQKIPGVVLVGGDVHVSRALRYERRVGYDLWQFVSSPMHDSVIESLNVPHPSLVHSAAEKRVFLRLCADSTRDPATLVATWIRADGALVFEVRLDARELSPPA
ncbi:MAG: alkaline phosphatase D family protein [Planctomycetes bacterium]|nr:alkaline phosphatase D family protein [Planctomycetota bacterium]